MARVICCFEHEEFETVDLTPDEVWNGQHGHGVVATATIDGLPRHLDCAICQWALDAAGEQDSPCSICHGEVGHRIDCPRGIAFSASRTLGSVGDPTEKRVKKEKKMAKPSTPKKRERRRLTLVGKKVFGGIGAVCYLVDDTRENWRRLTTEQFTRLQAFLADFEAELPRA